MADHRLRLATSHMSAFVCLIAAKIFEQTGGSQELLAVLKEKSQGLDVNEKWIHECAKDLVDNKGSSLVIAGRVEGPKGAARILGLNPSTLRSRMLKLGIRRPLRSKAEAPE